MSQHQHSSPIKKLDIVLSGLEEVLLSGNDQETVDSERDGRTIVELRSLLSRQMRRVNSLTQQDKPQSESQRTKKLAKVPRDIERRIRLFKTLLRSRPDLSPTLGAVLSGGKKPTKREIEAITNKLVRMGLLTYEKK